MGQNVKETAERKVLDVCATDLCMWVGNTCTDRETGGEATGGREHLGLENNMHGV